MRIPVVFRVAAVLAFAGCSSSGSTPSPDPRDVDGPGTLVIEAASPEEIRGAFHRADVVVRFHGRRSAELASLTVLTGAGDELFVLEGTATGSMVRMHGEDYLRSGDRVVAFAGDADGGAADAGPGGDDAGSPDQCTGSPASGEAYAAFLGAPEAELLPWLSAALGERGYDGKRYPSTMALHKLGMRVSRDTGITPPRAVAAAADTVCAAGTESGSGNGNGNGCVDISGNPNGDQCYGMCGNGCNCWRWVCGDCCCNVGCRTHDSHCRACSADSRRNWWDCVQCACFDWGNPLFDCTKCS